jgi:hypothetical protein
MNLESINNSSFQKKLTAILAVISGIAMCFVSYWHLDSAISYTPMPQQVFVDVFNRPIGAQTLSGHTFHNPDYDSPVNEGGPARDFLKESLLNLFNYGKYNLTSGGMLDRFNLWCSESEANELYMNAFVSLGQQRIVIAQDALVESRLVGDLKFIGDAFRPYETTSGLSLRAKTYKFEGTFIVNVHADKLYPTVYTVTALVQRSMIQDKIKGYQLIELEML